jgi:crotonobetainyl-CoA:carnitine CoA-transferase CaiB-like acyl-CoA transferase
MFSPTGAEVIKIEKLGGDITSAQPAVGKRVGEFSALHVSQTAASARCR